ncbi:uncharacterized protein LAESUDRAFT_745958 [Laetiporus sulphureus 93-53]|uniref:Uncharacterized protein n=1 Tax=Laetiporus sulphureus 93-53 TaxID=1314785 RepID=A0A165B1H7_9APHY|nr:uncharacterized protein LAESUDRAFT_745958 [Laetiporus sulphureus 93-53]KZT00053.1 hypothetical protein LAESUDRAFT_745958 [Laetiporus sulphureus 93-53]
MNVFAIGASRNIGYFAALRLLAQGATVTFFLRSPSVFDQDKAIQEFVSSGKARLVKGDALNADDVRRGWETAQNGGTDRVDLLLFTVGGTPSFSITRGIAISPRNLCTQSLLNVLSTLPASLRAPASQPRIVILSSIGLSRASHAALPLLLKPLYGYLLRGPHADKLAMERVVAYCAWRTWDGDEDELEEGILPEGWREMEGLPAEGMLEHVVVVRPALLTDGECRAETAGTEPPYRVADHDLGDGYRVSRKDVAHFIVEGLLTDWQQWEGKCLSIAY